MKITVDINDEDYLEYNMYYNFHSKIGRRNTWIMRLMVPVVCILLSILILAKNTDIIFTIIFNIFVIVIWELIVNSAFKRSIKRVVKNALSGEKPPYHNHVILEFLENEIVEYYNNDVSHYKKNELTRICESSDYYYIFVSEIQAIIVPKRCLGNSELIFRESLGL